MDDLIICKTLFDKIFELQDSGSFRFTIRLGKSGLLLHTWIINHGMNLAAIVKICYYVFASFSPCDTLELVG